MPEYTLRIRRFDPQSGEAALLGRAHGRACAGTQSVLDAILQIRDEKDGSIGIRCSCQQAICGSCGVRMNGKPGLACNTHLEDAAERGPRHRLHRATATAQHGHHGRADGQHARDPRPDRRHGRGPLEEDPPRHAVADQQAAGPRARIHRPARVHGRRHPDDGLHPVRRLRLGLPCRWRSIRCSSARPRWPRPTASSATRATPSTRSGSRTSPRIRARHLRLHPLLQLHRGLPEGRGSDEPDHAPAAHGRVRLTTSRTATTATATRTPSSRTSRATGCCTRPTCCPIPTAASSTRGPCPSCSARCRPR